MAICFGIWKFSTALNIDFASGAKCIGTLVGVTVLLIAYSKFGFELNRWVVAFGLSLYTLATHPVLDKWATDAVPDFMQGAMPMPFYGTWYFQLGLFLAPLLICWVYTKFFER
jgi:hypothetical protein